MEQTDDITHRKQAFLDELNSLIFVPMTKYVCSLTTYAYCYMRIFNDMPPIDDEETLEDYMYALKGLLRQESKTTLSQMAETTINAGFFKLIEEQLAHAAWFSTLKQGEKHE